MNSPEKYEVIVFGGGTAGKVMAWTMAKEGRRTAVIDRKYCRRRLPQCGVPPAKM